MPGRRRCLLPAMAQLPALLVAGDGALCEAKTSRPAAGIPKTKYASKRSETTVPEPLYEELGSGYAAVRRPDPRIAQRISEALARRRPNCPQCGCGDRLV